MASLAVSRGGIALLRHTTRRRYSLVVSFASATTTTTTSARPQRAFNSASDQQNRDLEVGELQGAKFKIEPLRRTGESPATMRARLLYQSRKRGSRESDLLLSTFAAAHLSTMSVEQLRQYDQFLDENDWDIYYWVTQDAEAPTASMSSTSGPEPGPAPGEWAQTVGAFRPAYRPVPARWADSEILSMLRKHVEKKRPGGEGGMGFMPNLE